MLAEDCHIIVVCDAPEGGNDVQHIRGRDIRAFCNGVLGSLFDGDIAWYDFALGFAAAIDAMASARVRLGDPLGTVRDAWIDVTDVGMRVPKVTDVLRAYCEEICASEVGPGELHQA